MKYFDKWVLTHREPPTSNVMWVRPTDKDGDKGAEIKTFIDNEWVTVSGEGYAPPPGGIPITDLSEEVQASLNKADTAYQKDNSGIPVEDLSESVQTSLDKADNAQEELVSGENIKTINNQSILGSGNIIIEGGDVESVNGQTGAVVLDAEDVGAASAEDLQDVADDVTALQAAYAGLTQSDIVPVESLPESGELNIIYRVAGTDSYSDYMWNGTQFIKMAEFTMSGDGAYDISANNSGATYDNITSALGTNVVNVPVALRKGGMSVKYIENVYADYSVTVTVGLTTEPTGTELDNKSNIINGIYKAVQLTDFSTLPATVGASSTYYVEVTESDVTTYTEWVLKKLTNDNIVYKQYRNTLPAYADTTAGKAEFIDAINWIEDNQFPNQKSRLEFRNKLISQANLGLLHKNVELGGFHKSGSIGSNYDWCHTEEYIPVKNGDIIQWFAGNDLADSTIRNNRCLLMYNNLKTQINYYTYNTVNRIITINDDTTKYIRPCFPNSTGWYITINGKLAFISVVEEEQVGTIDDVKLIIKDYSDYYYKIGYYVNGEVKFIKNKDWAVTKLLPISVGDDIIIGCPDDIVAVSTVPYKCGVYNSNKELFSYYGEANGRRIIIPSTLSDTPAYFSLSVRLADVEKFSLNINGVYVWNGTDIKNNIDFRIQKATQNLDDRVSFLEKSHVGTDIYDKNLDKLPLLYGASLRGTRLQSLIVTDVHADWKAMQNAVDFANKCDYISNVLFLGDYPERIVSQEALEQTKTIIESCTKPCFSIIGNHDVTWANSILYVADPSVVYEYLIRPILSNLEEGEYVDGTPYYYHDFTANKIRMIFLFVNEDEITFKPNSYWEAVTYDSTAPTAVVNTNYVVDDVVNFNLYIKNSFKCIADNKLDATTAPQFTEERGYTYIGETQMNWLVNTLLSTPSGYKVVICSHIPASQNHEVYMHDAKFCAWQEDSPMNLMADDYLGILAKAFNDGTSGTMSVSYTGNYSRKPSYSISYDFTNKNETAKFMCFIAGHTHIDALTRNTQGQLSVIARFTDSTTRQFASQDVAVSSNDDDITRDALTAVAFDTSKNNVILTRVGTTATTEGYIRDTERISCDEVVLT